MQNFILIGYGNLASAMMDGFSNHPDFRLANFYVFGRDFERAQTFASRYPNLQAISSLEEFVSKDSILILCIKPKGLSSLQLNQSFFLLYSVMAGVESSTLKRHFPLAQNITRAMPNVSAKVQKSATSLFCIGTHEAQALSIKLTQAFGWATVLGDESLIDASIATNGSSPAFLALIAEALIEAGVREGIAFNQSRELVYATFEGFAHLLSSSTPQEIKTLVTSPGGTTAEGLAYLESHALKGIIQEAAHQAVLKAKGKI
ncbi:pyrroline-5-carboxylate reductase [Helicobacter pametensis]|uniref:pyrroline-5-carboxylate reductase n=1 Tax=Helicobacter pametensis TaxID=95149 RepID=UPI00048A0ABB|nr:pyrroline-5-carboxylate reductase [Helicobacter pametensis]